MPASSLFNKVRRRLLRSLGAGCLLPLIGGCGSGEALTVASHVWPGYEMMFLARREGWLPKDQIRLLETASATESISALNRGLAQAAALTLDEVLRVRADGMPLTVVLVFDVSAGADVVLAGPRVQTLADLKGKLIGAETSALGALILARLLDKAGLSSSDVEVFPVSPQGHLEAWRSGQLDALISYEPTASHLITLGARRLLDSRQFPDTIFDVLAIRPEAAHNHADALKALIAAHLRGIRQLQQNPQDVAYRIAGHLALSGAEALQAFRGLHLPGLSQNQSLLAANGRLRSIAKELSTIMLNARLLTKADNLENLTSDLYLPPQEIP